MSALRNDISFSLITLGCAKNEVDSDKMKAHLQGAGYAFSPDINHADVLLINTCAFLTSAVEEGLDVIFECLPQENVTSKQKILVCGCMPSRYGEDLAAELTEVAGFVPADKEDDIVSYVDALFDIHEDTASTQLRSDISASCYVKISDGCDRFCAYCMIPYIRGRYHSYELNDILSEVDDLVSQGAKEIVFIGQDTGIWGKDLDPKLSIVDLLKAASQKHPDTWFRILYIQPEGITDALLELAASTPNICSYFDIPLQHVNAEVLKNMNRSGDPASLQQLVSHIREMVPGVMIRTTLMAGFPGETQEQADEVLDFIDAVGFDYAGVFAFSPEEGTKAADMPNQVEEEVRLQRAQKLLDACDAIGFKRTATHIGETHIVMVEDYEQTDVGVEALARWAGQAPEVDGQVHIPLSDDVELRTGDMVIVRFTDSFCYELVGELL